MVLIGELGLELQERARVSLCLLPESLERLVRVHQVEDDEQSLVVDLDYLDEVESLQLPLERGLEELAHPSLTTSSPEGDWTSGRAWRKSSVGVEECRSREK